MGTEDDNATAGARTWGPFTGRQLTTIICVGLITVLFPVGAWAVTGTNSFVTDQTTGKTAAVNASGQLATSAVVSGSVTATAASPKNLFNGSVVALPTTYQAIATPGAGDALVVTSLTTSYFLVGATGGNDSVQFAVSKTSASCASVGPVVFTDFVRGIGTTTYPFQPGLVVPAGRSLCLRLSDGLNIGGVANADGYRVPAASAPTGS